jgi:hypothetical protein
LVILGWEGPLFVNGAIIPVVFINLILGGFLFYINVYLGSIVAFFSIIFWGLVAYVFLSREVKEFYAEFERQKQSGSKTPK